MRTPAIVPAGVSSLGEDPGSGGRSLRGIRSHGRHAGSRIGRPESCKGNRRRLAPGGRASDRHGPPHRVTPEVRTARAGAGTGEATMGHLCRPRPTISGLMWSVLVAALALAAARAILSGDPELRRAAALLLGVLLACPIFAIGVAALARWAFTPPSEDP